MKRSKATLGLLTASDSYLSGDPTVARGGESVLRPGLWLWARVFELTEATSLLRASLVGPS